MKNSKLWLASCVVYQWSLSLGEECNAPPAQCKGQRALSQHRVAAEWHQVTLHGSMPRRKGRTPGSNPARPAWKAGICAQHLLSCSGKCRLGLSFLQGCGQMPPEPPRAADPWSSEQTHAVGKNKGVERESLFLRKRRGTGHSGSGQPVQGV